jgi:hypothetical protein
MRTPATGAGISGNAEQKPKDSAILPHEWEAFADRRISGAMVAGRPAKRKMRRVISREQGRALETIGHAVDYLNDLHLSEGPEDELLNDVCPITEAVQILVSLHMQLLSSLPLVEPLSHRLWNAIFHRHPARTSGVVPLSLR